MRNQKRRWRRLSAGTNSNNLNSVVARFVHVQDTRYVLCFDRSVRDGIGVLTFQGTVVGSGLDWTTALDCYLAHKAREKTMRKRGRKRGRKLAQ